jgi:energy-coupling factor transporter ATP-binding protein EcfA2
MTCVALLLAIFRSRPSPFCVLDEVDAALDEANVDRFVGVLRDFLSSTQFIVVTHSKKTMAAANTLYGVTMEESGVSKRVSVRFRGGRRRGPTGLQGGLNLVFLRVQERQPPCRPPSEHPLPPLSPERTAQVSPRDLSILPSWTVMPRTCPGENRMHCAGRGSRGGYLRVVASSWAPFRCGAPKR